MRTCLYSAVTESPRNGDPSRHAFLSRRVAFTDDRRHSNSGKKGNGMFAVLALPLAVRLPVVTPADLGVTASTYASFAEIMTGFSFAAIAIYLAYESAKGKHSTEGKDKQEDNAGETEHSSRNRYNTKEGSKQKLPVVVGREYPIRRTQVAATLFYGMASLAISSFLYASLTTQVESAPKVAAALLLYGVIFGASVLAFFYALTLMTYEHADTRRAAKAAYWVVVIIGPAVVLRFLADAAQGAWNSGTSTPENWSPPLLGGIIIIAVLLSISVLVSLKRIFEKWTALHGVCNWLCVRPVLPAFVIFICSAVVALAGILVTEPIKFVPSAYFIWGSLIGGFFLLAFFALACGCVVGPRTSRLTSGNCATDVQRPAASSGAGSR